MTDYFALLGFERRPWLDAELAKDTFHRLSREWHPDQQRASGESAALIGGQNGGGDFTVLNEAQQTLRDPKGRIRHLLALEYPEVSVSGPSAVPAALAGLMFPVQGLLSEANAYLARKNAATNDLSRALLAGEGFELQERVEEKLADLEARLAVVSDDLQKFSGEHWDSRPADAGKVLLGFYHGFSYLGRWIAQLREYVFQLAA